MKQLRSDKIDSVNSVCQTMKVKKIFEVVEVMFFSIHFHPCEMKLITGLC